MTAHDQFDGGFALADAGITGDHNAFAVNVQQNAVPGDAGSQLLAEIFHGMAGEVRSPLGCPQQRPSVVPGALQALCGTFHIPGQDQRRNGIGKQVIKNLGPPVLAHFHDIGQLRLAHDLDPAGVEIVEQAQNLQIRPVDVGRFYLVRFIGISMVQNFQSEMLHILCQAGAFFTHRIPPFHNVPTAVPASKCTHGPAARKSIYSFFPIIYDFPHRRKTFTVFRLNGPSKKLFNFFQIFLAFCV